MDFSKYQAKPTAQSTGTTVGTDFSKYQTAQQNVPMSLETKPTLSQSLWNNIGIVKDFGTIKDAAQSGIEQIKTGYDQAQLGNSPLQAFRGATNIAAGAVNTLFSPLAPVFKPVGDAINAVSNKIADIPAVQNFAQSKAGEVTSNVAEVTGNLSAIAGGVAGIQELPSQLKTVQKFAGDLNTLRKETFGTKPESIINKRVEALNNLDSQYAKLRKTGAYDKNHDASVKRIASTDVLSDAVDESGKLRTKNAVEQYTKQTLDGAENVIRTNLERTGETISPDALTKTLKAKIESNNQLQGRAKTAALKNVEAEVAGYSTDANGNIPLTAVQDAKVATYKVIKDFATPVEYKTYQKALGEGLKTAIEDNSSFNVGEVNAEIGKYLQDIAYLEKLDGTVVKGGKLGKYFAQISGNIIGGAAGAAIGGPLGSAAGTVIGGELGSKIKGNALQRTLAGETGYVAPKNPIIEKAVQTGNSPRLGLPAPKEGAPKVQIGSGQTIPLGSRTQSLADQIYENNLGNRNQQYNPINNTTKKVISPNPTTPKPTVKPVINSESALLQEAKKYKSAEEYVKAQGTPVLHGTGEKFDIFSDNMKGSITGAESAKGAIWFTNDPATAKAYSIYASESGPINKLLEQHKVLEKVAQKSGKNSDWAKVDALTQKIDDLGGYDATYNRRANASVKDAVIKGDLLKVDAKGKSPQELSADGNIDSWLNQQLEKAKKLGKDGVEFQNLDDAVGLYNRPATHYAIFDSKNIKTKSQLTDIWNKANKK